MSGTVSLSETFLEALASLEAPDTKRAAAFLLKVIQDPARLGTNFELIRDAHDHRVRSARVTQDLRSIAWCDSARIVLLYVAHHDRAYAWARARCISCDPVTGEITVDEIVQTHGVGPSAEVPYGASHLSPGPAALEELTGKAVPAEPLVHCEASDRGMLCRILDEAGIDHGLG